MKVTLIKAAMLCLFVLVLQCLHGRSKGQKPWSR